MEKILVIDDEAAIRNILSQVLTEMGYKVQVAEDGEKGIELFEQAYGFDLVITDICMPRVSGNSVAKHIRNSDRADTPIVAISGTEDRDIDHHAFNYSLAKPFKLESLIKVVKSIS